MTGSQKFNIILTKLDKLDSVSPKIDCMETSLHDMKNVIQGMKNDILGIKSDMQGMESSMLGMKNDIQGMKNDIQDVNNDVQQLDQRVISTQLHIENVTDRNIQLIAENFIELTNKLNKAIPAADKNLAYEVKVNYLAVLKKLRSAAVSSCALHGQCLKSFLPSIVCVPACQKFPTFLQPALPLYT